MAITGLRRIVIGRWQLTAGGLLREPAQFDDARPDTYVQRERVARRSGQAFLALEWSFGEASHGPPRRHCNAYEFARLDFLWRRLVCYRVCRFEQNSTRNRLLLPGLS